MPRFAKVAKLDFALKQPTQLHNLGDGLHLIDELLEVRMGKKILVVIGRSIKRSSPCVSLNDLEMSLERNQWFF